MNAVARKHEDAAADPIGTAVAKYHSEMTLPELTATSPDEVLIAHLARGGQPITHVQRQIEKGHLDARMSRLAPVEVLDDQYAKFWRAIRDLQQANPHPGSCRAEDWQCSIAILRLSLEMLATLVTFLDRWPTLNDQQRAEEARQAVSRMQHERTLRLSSGSGIGPAFSMVDFLAGLKSRGIEVTSNGTDLAVTNAAKLTPAERVILTSQKPTALAIVGVVETF